MRSSAKVWRRLDRSRLFSRHASSATCQSKYLIEKPYQADDDTNTNQVKSFFSRVQRAYVGIHHRLGMVHQLQLVQPARSL